MSNGDVKMQERGFSLLDLIVEILLHWRVMFVAALIGGILFAGISYTQSLRDAEAQQEKLAQLEAQKQSAAEEEKVEWEGSIQSLLEEQLTETQLSNVNNALIYEKLYEQKSRYWNESILMQMDPLNVPKTDLTFFVRSDDMERTYNIVKIYEDLLTSTSLFDYVTEKCNIEFGINELITLELTSYGEPRGNDIIRLAVRYSDADMCQAMADSVVEYIEQGHGELEEILGSYEITLLSRSYECTMSNSILNQQKACVTEIINLQNSFLKLKTNFSDEEWQYYNYLAEGKVIEETEAEALKGENVEVSGTTGENDASVEQIIKPSINMKYVFVGFVLFTFAYVFVICVAYIFGNKIRVVDNFQELCNIPQLGTILSTKQNKKFLGIVDRWILKLRYYNLRKFTPSEAISLVVTAIKIAAKKHNLNNVCLLGCSLSEEAMDVCEKIMEGLSKEEITVKILNNVIYDAEAMSNLEDVQSAVFVETVGTTMYREIEKEMELLNRQSIILLGGVIVE